MAEVAARRAGAPRASSSRFAPGAEAWGVAVFTAVIYLITASNNLHKHPYTQFDQLADAFLHGRLWIAEPANIADLTRFQGRWYVPFPPLPALLMLPVVALVGPTPPFETPFSIVLASIGVALMFLLLHAMRERGWTRLDPTGVRWMTALFAFGTANWYASCSGTVWFLSHVATVLFVTLALLLAARKAPPLWVGSALGLAMWARPHLALALPFLGAELVSRDAPRRPAAREWAMLLLPVAVAGLALLAYNAARFGDWRDFGYATQSVADDLKRDLATYGQFHPHFFTRNFYWEFLSLPVLKGGFPFLTPDPHGMSVLLATPALFYLARGAARGASHGAWAQGAWISLLLINLLLLLYYNTGWFQFGFRFSLDYVPFAMLLLAGSVDGKPSPLLRWLIAASIVVNLWGTWWWFTR